MSDLPDITNYSASKTIDLMARCADHLDQMRRAAMQQAELLGLTCAIPGAKQRKPRLPKSQGPNGDDRPNTKQTEHDNG